MGKVYPEQIKIRIWDFLRRRKVLDLREITAKQQLINRVRKLFGLKKGEIPKGKAKSILRFIQKSDFWEWAKQRMISVKAHARKARQVSGYSRFKPQRWTEGEVRYLLRLKAMGKKGSELVKLFQKRYSRTASSILSKASRLKKGGG